MNTPTRRYWFRVRIMRNGAMVGEADMEIGRDTPICSSADLAPIVNGIGDELMRQGGAQLGDQVVLLNWQPFEAPALIVAARPH